MSTLALCGIFFGMSGVLAHGFGVCKTRHAKERGDECYDQTSEQKVVNRDAVRLEWWNTHLLFLTEALRRFEDLETGDSSTAGDLARFFSRRVLNGELVGDCEVGTRR